MMKHSLLTCCLMLLYGSTINRFCFAQSQGVNQGGPAFVDVYSFTSGAPGACPGDLIQGTDGKIYGVTEWGGDTRLNGGSGFGCLFSLTASNVIHRIYSFTDSDGSVPNGVIQGQDGSFYGTTLQGGDDLTLNDGKGYGTMFKITRIGIDVAMSSVTFPGGSQGGCPLAKLVQAKDGSFYGTTTQGGEYDKGTLFQIPSWGTLNILHSFDGSDGYIPNAPMIQATDGNLYGTTWSGGDYGGGTTFELTSTGQFYSLHSFSYVDGSNPSGLVQGKDGYFYGTTETGGQYSSSGTVFRMTWTGTITTLYSFTGGRDGAAPVSGLCYGHDGNFYGTTVRGGLSNKGTIFKITPEGTLTTLYSFTIGDGGAPEALLQGSDGNLYGTTDGGGAYSRGAIFELSLPH